MSMIHEIVSKAPRYKNRIRRGRGESSGLVAVQPRPLHGVCADDTAPRDPGCCVEQEAQDPLESVAGQIEDLQTKQKATDTHLAATDQKVSDLSQEAQDALKRAQEAGVLAKGKVVFQQTFSEDRVKFKSGAYDLNKDAQSALDEFAGKVKALNEQYFVEIQGHTDDVGGRKYNDELGQRRARNPLDVLGLVVGGDHDPDTRSHGPREPIGGPGVVGP